MAYFDKATRALAHARNHYLMRLTLDGRERTPPSGETEWEVTLSPECHLELLQLLKRWCEEGLI